MAQGNSNDGEISVSDGGTDETPETIKERDEVKALLKTYNAARGFDKEARKKYAVDRKYASGKSNSNWAVDANMIGTFIDILVSFLYAKDPDVSIRAAEVVGDQPSEDNDHFAATLRLIVSRFWKKGRLKKYARKAVRSSLTTGPGWLKVIMVANRKLDPLIERDLNDLQDNLIRLKAKRQELKNEDGELNDEELNVAIAEKEQLEVSLQSKLEIAVRHGLAIDFVRSEDMQVSLDVAELSDYLNANWNGNQMFVEKSELGGMFPRLNTEDVKSARTFFQRNDPEATQIPDTISDRDAESHTTNAPATGGDQDAVKFARVVEIWDKRDNHIKTLVDGVGKWARKPYQPPYATSRFYPYFNISLFEVDGERHAQSLTGRMLKLQDEYASTRSSGRLARSRSIPGVLFDAGKITADDVRKIEAAVEQEYIGINPVAGDDLSKAFTAKPVGNYDSRVYDTRPILQDMERIGGVQEALSQATTVTKTATEAGIQQQGFQSRTGADRDTLEDTLTDLAEYTSELAIQSITADEAKRIAGDLSFWPEGMDFEDIVTMAEVEIEAGSTAKPNTEAERASWSTVLPLIRETMVIIQQAFAQGNKPLAEALTELLQETLSRMDDRVNLKRFIPDLAQTPVGAIPAGGAGGQEGVPGQPGAPGAPTAPLQ